MPRTARAAVGGVCYHVLNRGNARAEVFHKEGDYAAFLKLLGEAGRRVAMRLLAYCLMPNHFHLVVWPRGDDDLGRYMQWLSTSHVRRYHRHYGGSGHVWQGRYKAFPIQEDEHLLTVMRYVERNPVRARTIPIRKAERWPWSSLGTAPRGVDQPSLDPGPVPRGSDWLSWVNRPLTEEELTAERESVARGSPYGAAAWRQRTAVRLGLEFTLRPRGRPRK
ncbi:MAG: transposase [Gammaproteobacteria bacterium]